MYSIGVVIYWQARFFFFMRKCIEAEKVTFSRAQKSPRLAGFKRALKVELKQASANRHDGLGALYCHPGPVGTRHNSRPHNASVAPVRQHLYLQQ